MKKCPYCKTDIEENSNFCLYCMTSLNKKEVIADKMQKRSRLLVGMIIILFAVFISGGILLLNRSPNDDSKPQSNMENLPQTLESTEEPFPNETLSPISTPEETDYQEKKTDLSQPIQLPVTPDSKPPVFQPEVTEPETSAPETADPIQTSNPQTVTEPEITEPAPTQVATTPPASQSDYLYRLAQQGDELNANYTNSGNDIVITGVRTPSPDGVYHIPAYIDGKRVLTIASNAFYGSGAKKVYVPASVKNIFNYAFNDCPLTDIYFYGSSINVEKMAFYPTNGTVTIHCSASCNDRAFRTFQNSAHLWDAQWEEWNG